MFNVDENLSFLHVSFFDREFDFTSSFATLIIFIISLAKWSMK